MYTSYPKLELAFYGILLCFLMGCASTGSPSGGPRDITPPKLVEEKSSQNFSTNYTPEKIELVFNEWIELKNQKREILISPPFFRNPKITSRGKKVTVEFPEEEPLREDATYTINFGKSIVDFTESNPAEGFRFVFATGDKIDSLEFSGGLEDAITGEPVKDILVLLYDIVEDSVVVQDKPFYYARTDDQGQFKFQNLKNDTFKLLVLEDLNFNYLLDAELERLAFPDSLFILNDSSSYNPQLRLFEPEQRLRILNSSSQVPGLITTIFNKKAEEVDFSFLYPFDFYPQVEESEDTLLLWYTEPLDSVGIIYGVDTLDFTTKPFDSTFYNQELVMYNSNADKTTLAPFDSLELFFSAPILNIDTSLIQLTNVPVVLEGKGKLDSLAIDTMGVQLDSLNTKVDSLNVVSDTTNQQTEIELDSLSTGDSVGIDSTIEAVDTALISFNFTTGSELRKAFIKSKWNEGFNYKLTLLPGAVSDIYNRINDTTIIEFKTASFTEFGNISVNMTGLDSNQQYIILLKLGNEIIRRSIVADSIPKKIEYKRLKVNTYSIDLIKDDNRDGKWTTGDYWLKRQPEFLKSFPLEKLRENWDLEANVYWNEPLLNTIDTLGVRQDSIPANGQGTGTSIRSDIPKPKGNKNTPNNVPNPKGRND